MAQLQSFNPLGAFLHGQQQAQQLAQGRQQQQLGQQRLELGQQQLAQQQRQAGISQEMERTQFLNNAGKALLQLPDNQWQQAIQRITPLAEQLGIPAGQIDPAQLNRQNVQELVSITGQFLANPDSLTAAQREFQASTEGFSAEEVAKARRIKAGLEPRAVGSAIQTIATAGTAEDIGEAEKTISERKKFGELTGASRAKTIDAGFDKIASIDKNVSNIDRAIDALNRGAGTGSIESRFFPSIKAASVELDQIRGELALDVVGAVTFGALSEGELDLAQEVALPTKLDKNELIDFLQRKKEAQAKLRSYFNDQIQFLDQGGSVAGFLRQQERQRSQQPTQAPQAGAQQQRQDGQIMVDANGNRAMVFPDGTFEEL